MSPFAAAALAFVFVASLVPLTSYVGNRWMYGVDVNGRRILSGSLLMAPIFGVIGALVAGSLSSALGASLGLPAGLLVGSGLFAALLFVGGRDARRITVLAERLRHEADRDTVVLALRREAEQALAAKNELMVTHIVNELSAAGRWADAVATAEQALATKLDAYCAEMLRLSVLVGMLFLGRGERAEEVRASLAESGVAEAHEWVVAYLDALAAALGGEPEAALAAMPDEPVHSRSMERTRLCIRAHALAALHRQGEALAELEALRALTGDPYLEAHAGLDQPASPLARQLLTGERGPYRG